jgi:hypothetical protein
MKIIRSSAGLLIFALSSLLFAAGATDDKGVAEEVRDYTGIGRIKWMLPKNADFYFAVPHWTSGPRLKCKLEDGERGKTPMGSADCEIGVLARDFTMDAEKRKKEFFDEMQPLLKDVLENSLEIKSYGAGNPIYYVTLTDKRAKEEWRYATVGLYVRGPFVIKFHHLTNDSAELNKVLQLVYSAESLDTLAVFAWKLSDSKTVCDKRFPQLKQINDAAFAASMFAKVDWLKLWYARDPSVPIEKIASGFAKAKDDLAKRFSDGPVAECEAFCKSYPRQVKDAERAM